MHVPMVTYGKAVYDKKEKSKGNNYEHYFVITYNRIEQKGSFLAW